MANTSDPTLHTLYKLAVVTLLAVLSFLGVRIYGKVDDLPYTYVTRAAYDQDCTRQEKLQAKSDQAMNVLGEKMDEVKTMIMNFHVPSGR